MIAVLGATGFIGSHLLAYLLDDGAEIVAVYRNKASIAKSEKILQLYNIGNDRIQRQLKWAYADISDIFSLKKIFENVTYIYNCAGFVSFCPSDKESLFETNVKGTAAIVDAALETGISKICHVSSIATLGSLPEGELHDETIIWNGNKNRSFYSITKHLAENEMWRGAAENLPTVIVCPSIILGEKSVHDPGNAIFRSLKNRLSFYSKGAAGFVDVKDVCKAMMRLMQSEIIEEKLIISGVNLSYHDLFSRIARSYGRKSKLKKAPSILLSLTWRFLWLCSLVNRKKPTITKETVRSSKSTCFYSNSKSVEILGLKYTPIDETIARLTKFYN